MAGFFRRNTTRIFLHIIRGTTQFWTSGKRGQDGRQITGRAIIRTFLHARTRRNRSFPQRPLFRQMFGFKMTIFINTTLLGIVINRIIRGLFRLFNITTIGTYMNNLMRFKRNRRVYLHLIGQRNGVILNRTRQRKSRNTNNVNFLQSSTFI